MKNAKLLILLFIVFLLKFETTQAQMFKFKAIFIYNFTKYIDWTSEYKNGDFVFGVLGNSPIIEELQISLSKKKITNQKIVVKKFSSVYNIKKCHVLYIPSRQSGQLKAVLTALSGKPTLIVGDKKDMTIYGADINFLTIERGIKYEISKKKIAGKGLKVSQKLIDLGINVDN